MELTVEINGYISRLKKDIAEAQEEVAKYAKAAAKAAEKGNLADVRHNSRMVKMTFDQLDNLEEYLEEAKRRLVAAERIEAGYGVIVEFLESLLQKDIEWHKELKADYQAKGYKVYADMLKNKKITLQVMEFARMSETDARKIFQRDLDARYAKLVHQLQEKAGNVIEVQLQRNDNSGLDGRVIGEKKTVYVDTILAGGYNIQRLHYRTLIK